jgi:hypothetical protein
MPPSETYSTSTTPAHRPRRPFPIEIGENMGMNTEELLPRLLALLAEALAIGKPLRVEIERDGLVAEIRVRPAGEAIPATDCHRWFGPQRARDLGLRAEVERASGHYAESRIIFGDSNRRAQAFPEGT